MTGRRSLRLAIAVAAAAALVVPLGVHATTASWTDREWVHGDGVGTSSLVCGQTPLASTASGRFLSGSLLGTDLDALAALRPQSLRLGTDGALTVSPPGSIDRGSTPPTYTYTNPLSLALLGGVAGLDLTGLQVGLPIGSAGAVNQYAQVSGLGAAAGASGLVSNTGAVLVSAGTPDDQLPEPATVSLASLLPSVAGVAVAPALRVGAVGARAQLDGCAALRSSIWGDGTVTGVTRDYGIAELGLSVDSPAVASIVTRVNAAVTALDTAVAGLVGPNGAIASLVNSRIVAALGGVAVGVLPATGTVSITGLNLQATANAVLGAPLSDGVMSVNLSTGRISVDLAALLSTGPNALNGLAPNTQLVVNATVVNEIVRRVGALLDTRIAQVVSALDAALRAATVNVSLTIGLTVLGITAASVAIRLTATIGSIVSTPSTAAFTIAASVLPGLLPPVSTLINGLIGGVRTLLAPLTTGLVAPLASLLATSLLGVVSTLGTTLSGVSASVVSGLASVLAPLPGVVSLVVNVQPDRPNAPPGTTFVPGTDDATPQYSVTALRLGLAAAVGGIAHVAFGTATAGPVGVR